MAIPKIIYLQGYNENKDTSDEDVTWRVDKINEDDLEYNLVLPFPICAEKYHAMLDEQGDRYCRTCGKSLQ